MSSRVMEGRREPMTFANAPTVEHEGRQYLTDEAAEVLADQLAEKYSSLLAKLAEE